MSPKFCQRQALLFYVESEPRGTSPVPKSLLRAWFLHHTNTQSVQTGILNPEPSDWRTYVLNISHDALVYVRRSGACFTKPLRLTKAGLSD